MLSDPKVGTTSAIIMPCASAALSARSSIQRQSQGRSVVGQPLADQARKIIGGARLHARGDLFGENLEKEFRH